MATLIVLLGVYASWFASQSSDSSNLLMNVVSYVVSALTDPLLCLQAAIALRNLCDANRKVLAPQIGAFAELHAGLGSIPVWSCLAIPSVPTNMKAQDTEKSKVLQSIASVIQALPPGEGIPPIEVEFSSQKADLHTYAPIFLQAIVDPIVQKLAVALQPSSMVRATSRSISNLCTYVIMRSSRTKRARWQFNNSRRFQVLLRA